MPARTSVSQRGSAIDSSYNAHHLLVLEGLDVHTAKAMNAVVMMAQLMEQKFENTFKRARERSEDTSTASRANSAPTMRAARSRKPSGGKCDERRPLCASENATPGRESAMREYASSQRPYSVASLFRNLRRAGVLK